MKRLWFVIGITALLAGIGLPFLPLVDTQAQDDNPLIELNVDVIKRATVFVMQTYQSEGQPVMSCVDSGTLISADGLILTNAHTILASETCQMDQIVIAMTVRLDEPPIPTYTAEVLDASRGLDLAVLRINGYLDGRAIERGVLQLPFVEMGDSDTLALDETITVIGYPDIGSEPVAVARGTVAGFTAEARAGDRAWIRTEEASIPGTMTGGGAYNRDGKLIGIPTVAPARAGGETIDCRVIQDSNRDGRADQSDTCVPVGGFISALRPSRLARGLVRAATLGIRQGDDLTNTPPPVIEDAPVFTRPFFTTRINEAGVPSSVVGGVPAGTSSLYLFFDYNNMVDGMVYELRVTVDEQNAPLYGLPPVTWSGSKSGTWYIGTADTVWRNGVYNFRLFVEGREVVNQSIVVGGGPRENPAFSDIVFGIMSAEGSFSGSNYVLPEGSLVQARFNYRNMQPGTTWTQVWYHEGAEIIQNPEAWPAEAGTQGVYSITAENTEGGFLPGQYRLALYIDGVLSATADFVIAGGAVGSAAEIFSNLRFTTEETAGAPLEAEFPAGTPRLYVFFNWNLIAPGTVWTRRWLVDDDVLFEVTEPWDAASQGENYFVSLDSLDTLPDGTYRLEISIAHVTLESIEAKVGLGQLPVGTFASAEGVQMMGRITDAENGEGIPGAMFIVLQSEYSIEDFLWTQSQVLGLSLADSQGRFQVPVLLPRGTEDEPILYSVLVRAEGYLPVNADGIIVIDSTESPVELNVELSHN